MLKTSKVSPQHHQTLCLSFAHDANNFAQTPSVVGRKRLLVIFFDDLGTPEPPELDLDTIHVTLQPLDQSSSHDKVIVKCTRRPIHPRNRAIPEISHVTTVRQLGHRASLDVTAQ